MGGPGEPCMEEWIWWFHCVSAMGCDSYSPYTYSSRSEPTVCSRISGPINLPMHSSSDTSHTHAGHCACTAEPHMHSQCFKGWPFFLADQKATWQLEQMPHQQSHCAEAVAFYVPLPPLPFYLSTPPKSGPVWHKRFQLNYANLPELTKFKGIFFCVRQYINRLSSHTWSHLSSIPSHCRLHNTNRICILVWQK